MLVDFILDNQDAEKANKTLSGFNNYTGREVEFLFTVPERGVEPKNDDEKEKEEKFLRPEEVYLPI